MNGLYQLPYNIDVGASVFGRQGYPFPIFQSAKVGTDPAPNVRNITSPTFQVLAQNLSPRILGIGVKVGF